MVQDVSQVGPTLLRWGATGVVPQDLYVDKKILLPGGQHVKLDNCKQWNVDMALGTGNQTVTHMASSTITMKTRGLMKSHIQEGDNHFVLDCFWNVMAHMQKPDFIFQRNGRSPFKSAGGRQFSRLLAAEVCTSAAVMLDTPCSGVVWRVLATHSIRQFALHFPSCVSPCAITFQLYSTTSKLVLYVTPLQKAKLWMHTITSHFCYRTHNRKQRLFG
jgi:hypothetical protein